MPYSGVGIPSIRAFTVIRLGIVSAFFSSKRGFEKFRRGLHRQGRSVMQIAAIYDIHGNLPALEAVLQDISLGCKLPRLQPATEAEALAVFTPMVSL